MARKTSRVIRFGLIGYGKHGQWAVVPAMRAAVGVRLAAVADLMPSNLALLDDKSITGYTDYRQMLKREELDAVYVATRVETHCEAVTAALQAGLHVITEKPMATSIRECRQMIAAAQKAGKLLGVDFESRYITGFQQIRKWIAAGHIGHIRAIHIDNLWDGHKIWGPLGKRRRRFCDSSGCLDCGIHKLDLTRYFSGGGTWRDIKAFGTWFGEHVKYPPHIAIMACLDTGVLVTLNASFAFTAYIKRRLQGVIYDGLAILGDRGVIVLHKDPKGEKHLELAGEKLAKTIPFTEHGHSTVITLLLNDFAKSIRANTSLPAEIATGYDGLMAQYCADEANRLAIKNGDTGLLTPAK
ncbi:MAG: Gfo/Idh/MocA family oxidoreductase [Verrucomicrobia bacterium]|nr:Gfo/Idh/MocA family oxidoreductase [Verrucomicrobiota bacterium]MBU4429238.1 Gfo/Idh/MocA family oxidoreductase [Verrucomicrobiota bacterium]MCG2680373.1 Gfo/Idh/MocA family oxidoreductase [Kiritimatiellia bacterium]